MPSFDADGNQTLVRTATGIWSVTYNAENRPVIFQKTTDSITTRITCTYDSMGRRATKKVEEITTDAEGNESANVISQHRFIYRGYLQIACCDLTRATHPCLWLITWDPTQPVATRPLAIQKDGRWFCYGWDLTKNICEVFGQNGYIRTAYSYTPYGSVTANGDITQPIQWSSEYADSDLALVYYNYRHYNPMDGRWLGRDPIGEVDEFNLYSYVNSSYFTDYIGAWGNGNNGITRDLASRGHSDFPGHDIFDYTIEDTDAETSPYNPKATWRHFRPLDDSEKDLTEAVKKCDKDKYERYAHQMQDFFAHYGQGFRANKYDKSTQDAALSFAILLIPKLNYKLKREVAKDVATYPLGHGIASIMGVGGIIRATPDNAEHYNDAYEQAYSRSQMWLDIWNTCCCLVKQRWVPRKGKYGIICCKHLKQPKNPFGSKAAPPKVKRYRYRPYIQKAAENPTTLKLLHPSMNLL